MRLIDFVKRKKITLKEFCSVYGFNYGTMKLYSSNHARPSPDMALRISEATGGRVTVLELLYPDKKEKAA